MAHALESVRVREVAFARTPSRLVMGEDDRHLDFRVVLDVAGEAAARAVTVATVVRYRNAFGRAYFALVRPFHRLVVPAMVRSGLPPRRAP